ncbi:hypothetical protein [Streptomyces sp. MB09-02B]|uniref:hypothetical protein n=1 Tax=Streptomyces sp. MB09-02B TaxID=3028667 RepID=UPI0029ACC116|nr:hypothetical protein [Streptomyces sp. MB09-02B]MDX3640163.1 hypothetical protein [Streptomyces sp. MB09-02B]
MRRLAAVLLVLCSALVSCSSKEGAAPSTSPSVGKADLNAVEHRWAALTHQEQQRVCAYADNDDGNADMAGALEQLREHDYSEAEAAEMLPYILNECT